MRIVLPVYKIYNKRALEGTVVINEHKKNLGSFLPRLY